MSEIYKLIDDYLPELGSLEGLVLEIGSERGEGSTAYLDNLAKQNGAHFVTVDIDQPRIEEINKQGIHAVCQKGEDFIPTLSGKPVSIAYLDNYDWNWWVGRENSDKHWVQHQIDWYKDHHEIEMSNVECQQIHLLQSILLEEKTTDNSLIVFDDTWLDSYYQVYKGKGGAAVTYLLLKGYKVLFTQEYGTILGRFK